MIAAVVPCTRTPSSQPRSIPGLLDAQVRRRSGATAAIAERGDRIEATTWNELGRRVRDLADGFASVGVEKGDRVALLADTALDAVVAGLAVVTAGGVMVPIDPTSTPRDREHVLADSGATWIVCDVEAQADKVHGLRERVPALRGIVRLSGPARGPIEVDAVHLARAAEVARAREGNAYAAHLPTLGPHDPICIIYTSGTTGNPKGVLLTHGNWLYAAEALARVGVVVEDDVCLLFPPIAHGFAWLCVVTCIQAGAGMAFTSIDRVVEAAGRLHPTFIPAPPRLYEKIYAGAVAAGEAERGVKRRLFRLAMDELERATAARVRGLPYSSLGLRLARKVVVPRIARAVSQKLGGRVRVLVSGSAPLSPRIYGFFEALGLTLLEGFGQSECTGAATVNLPGSARIGTVGPPLPGTEIRIAEDGEILLRNPGVMQGYWRNAAATAEALRGGWLHTGHVGQIDERGYLRITDRKEAHHRDLGRKDEVAAADLRGAVCPRD